jgi:acid stress-induced BolA-like protein IbaG/YrbA
LLACSYKNSSQFQTVRAQYLKTGVSCKVEVEGDAELVEVLVFDSNVDVAPLAESHNVRAFLRHLISEVREHAHSTMGDAGSFMMVQSAVAM